MGTLGTTMRLAISMNPQDKIILTLVGGFQFVQAYDYYDGTLHTTNPDWYNLGTGTTINVGYFY